MVNLHEILYKIHNSECQERNKAENVEMLIWFPGIENDRFRHRCEFPRKMPIVGVLWMSVRIPNVK